MQVQVSLNIDIEATASISQMEQDIQAAGQQAMREAFKHTVRQWEEQHRPCPQCGQQPSRLEGTASRSLATNLWPRQAPSATVSLTALAAQMVSGQELVVELERENGE
ncbi:MAG: hypothetical protein J2P37_07405 [Ktedonobacteraceae bacterium]|nr:hypothetical protein [Ktedonobacteraceae bacterium]